MYFWGGASIGRGRELSANEYVHWMAMSLAVARGVRPYDMCGSGRFKKKFGGDLRPVVRWRKSYPGLARWARRGYEMTCTSTERCICAASFAG